MKNITPYILLVDDDAEDRQIILDTFDDLGFASDIHFEENGEDAIRYLQHCAREHRLPNLVILDLNMPRMNGTQVLRYLKGEASLKDITVIIFSTSLNPIERDECLALGAHSYVIKPVSYKQSLEIAKTFHSLSSELNGQPPARP